MYQLGSTARTIAVGRNLFQILYLETACYRYVHETVAKILNSWLQRAIILLRKRFPAALVLNDFKI